MKKLKNIKGLILGLFLIATIALLPQPAQATICKTGSFECYWNVEHGDCQPFYYVWICAVCCDDII